MPHLPLVLHLVATAALAVGAAAEVKNATTMRARVSNKRCTTRAPAVHHAPPPPPPPPRSPGALDQRILLAAGLLCLALACLCAKQVWKQVQHAGADLRPTQGVTAEGG